MKIDPVGLVLAALRTLFAMLIVALVGLSWWQPARADHCPPPPPDFLCGVTIFTQFANYLAFTAWDVHGEKVYDVVNIPPLPIPDQQWVFFDWFPGETLYGMVRVRLISSEFGSTDVITLGPPMWAPGSPCYCPPPGG